MKKALHLTALLISLVFTLLFAWAYYDRYWKWRDCFNDLGRCYDPETQMVMLEQAGPVWALMGFVSFNIFLLLLVKLLRR